MTRRIKRTPEFEVALTIHTEDFIKTPRAAQRNWVLNRALKEFCDDLAFLNRLAASFVAGAEAESLGDRTQRDLTDLEIMEDWQIPIMKSMAAIAANSHEDVLEVGFGRGIASTFVQQMGVRTHTIVECNDSVVRRFEQWKRDYSTSDIRLLHGRWQDRVEELGHFDGILFHTYPLTDEDFVEQVAESQTFAEHFFETAAAHLRPGGRLTYLTNEPDSLSRGHQRSLFRHFRSLTLTQCRELALPQNTRDAQWVDSMVIIEVRK